MIPSIFTKKRARPGRHINHYRKLAMTTGTSASRRGPSSYHMQNPEPVFDQLDLHRGTVFLDLGCGAGDYALRAAEAVGRTGVVHVMDVQERSPRMVAEEAALRGLPNVRPHVGDMRTPLPIASGTVDVCLIAQVLHALGDRPASIEFVFREVRRVLHPQGLLAVIECKKEDASFGPPLSVRLGPDDLIPTAKACGFSDPSNLDLGVSYLLRFCVVRGGDR